MRQRLVELQAALRALEAHPAPDADAWSDSSADEDQDGAGPSSSRAPTAGASKPDGSAAAAGGKAGQAAQPAGRALVETEREKQIRMGLITPFQNVAGVATGVTRAAPPTAAPRLQRAPLFSAAANSKQLSASATKLAQRQRAAEADRLQTKEMAPGEVDEDMVAAVRRQEWFKQRPTTAQSKQAAQLEKAARYKRAVTLPKLAPPARERRAGSKRSRAAPAARTDAAAAKPGARRKKRKHEISEDDFSGAEETDAAQASSGGGSASKGGRSGSSSGHGSDSVESLSGDDAASDDSDRVPSDIDDAGVPCCVATVQMHSRTHRCKSQCGALVPVETAGVPCCNSDNGRSMLCLLAVVSHLCGNQDSRMRSGQLTAALPADSDFYEWRLEKWEEAALVATAAPTGNKAVRAAVLADASRPTSPAPASGTAAAGTTDEADPSKGASASSSAAAGGPAAEPAAANAALAAGAERAGARPAAAAAAPPSAGNEAAEEAGAEAAEEQLPEADADVYMDGGFSMAAAVYDRLFPYQQVGVKWMWELHLQRAGGVLSEMPVL